MAATFLKFEGSDTNRRFGANQPRRALVFQVGRPVGNDLDRDRQEVFLCDASSPYQEAQTIRADVVGKGPAGHGVAGPGEAEFNVEGDGPSGAEGRSGSHGDSHDAAFRREIKQLVKIPAPPG